MVIKSANTAASTPPEKERVAATSFKQLTEEMINVSIEREETVYLFKMRRLTQSQYLQIEQDTPLPPPPVLMAGRDGNIYDRQNPDWQLKVAMVANERSLRRIVMSLVDFELEGDTIADKAKYLYETCPTDIMGGLVRAFNQLNGDRDAVIEARAATFQQ